MKRFTIEYYRITGLGNMFFIGKDFAYDTKIIDTLINAGKTRCKKFLHKNDNLIVLLKNEKDEVLDKYTFEPQEIKGE